MFRIYCVALACALNVCTIASAQEAAIHKVKDIVIYEDASFYSAFPSLVTRPDGEILCAFRRAPERKVFGEGGSNHTDANSYLVLVRSRDDGATWSRDPELILAHPFGGSQDPCMNQLADGSIVCSSYGWAQLRGSAAEKFDASLRHGDFVFMGGYLVRSEDGGATWGGLITPPPVPGNAAGNVFGQPAPAYNRGQMAQAEDGTLFWAVASQAQLNPRRTEVHLMASGDGGQTWEYRCPIAQDDEATFNEAALVITASGALVTFLRTANFNDHTVIARSTDGGQSFQPWEDTGFQGHPHHALRLPDDRVLLVYGYRHEPYGIRARLLDAECTDAGAAAEVVLRDDGGSRDIGYPWSTLLPNGQVLVAYYFNVGEGTRHIAGTVVEVK